MGTAACGGRGFEERARGKEAPPASDSDALQASPPLPPRAQKILLQRTTGTSHIGEVAPMALCDIHVAGCGEHLPSLGSL